MYSWCNHPGCIRLQSRTRRPPIDADDSRYWEIFFEIHTGLPREAPGDEGSAERALKMVPEHPAEPWVLDLACGPGAATSLLATRTGGRVVAVDLHAPFLGDVRRKAENDGVSSRVFPVHANMEALPVEAGGFDLVWSEGALYNVGFGRGLEICRDVLKPGGGLAATEVVWLDDHPPAEARAWWKAEYPGITNVGANIRTIEESGFALLGHFTLPASAWWDYYRPIEARLTALRERHADDAQIEIDMYRRYSESYSYEFFVCRKE
jgi:SAM-dependent methyltransferase